MNESVILCVAGEWVSQLIYLIFHFSGKPLRKLNLLIYLAITSLRYGDKSTAQVVQGTPQ